MQISKYFFLVCAASCAAILPLRAAEPAAQPSPAPAAQPPADSENIAKAREALREKMKELEAKPSVSTNTPAAKQTGAKSQPTVKKTEAKSAVEKASKKSAAVKSAPVFSPIQAPPPSISADKQQRLAELLRKYKAEDITPEEYHQQRAKIMSEP